MLALLEALGAAAAGLKFGKLMLLVEGTVGAGTQLGGRFEELATIREFAPRFTDLPVGFAWTPATCSPRDMTSPVLSD